ncbi:MAG TPA: hypothetical protein VIJ60_01825 [Acidimicrobiales bacterium]|jgi:hypothetical protein
MADDDDAGRDDMERMHGAVGDAGGDAADGAGGAGPDEQHVESRASGRLPEERDSDDPEDQARVILEESEERVMARERQSETGV